MDKGFIESLGSDLRYIYRTWDQDIDSESLRVTGGILRRLLHENNQGTLIEGWKALGFEGNPILISYTVDKFIAKYAKDIWDESIYDKLIYEYLNGEGDEITLKRIREIIPEDSGLWFGFAGGGAYKGLLVSGAAIGLKGSDRIFVETYALGGTEFGTGYNAAKTPGGPEVKELTYHRFKTTPCVFIFGKTVNRIELIRYICDKRGAVHYDLRLNPSNPTDRKFILLNIFNSTNIKVERVVEHKPGQYVSPLDAVKYEFLSTGQSLVHSKDIKKLMLRIKQVIGY